MKEIAHDKEEAIPKPGDHKFPVSVPGRFLKSPLKGPLTSPTLETS